MTEGKNASTAKDSTISFRECADSKDDSKASEPKDDSRASEPKDDDDK